MRTQLMVMAAVGSLMVGTAMAQTGGTAGSGAITQEDIEQLKKVFDQAGFTGFEPVAGAEAFRGTSAGQESAVIAIAPDDGTTRSGTSAGAAGGMDSQVYRVTTAEGRTLLIVMAPGMNTTASAGTNAGSTTASGTANASSTTAGTTASGTTTTDTASGSTTGSNNASAENTAGSGADTAASTEKVEATIELEGNQEVPPVDTKATGETAISFDPETRTLSWELSYSGLSGDVKAAHFHGPADPGEKAPPVVPIEDTANGSDGSAKITEAQAKQLMDGKWYVNVHTADHPQGEIRGQVVIKQ